MEGGGALRPTGRVRAGRPPEHPGLERLRINLSWLLKLRWAAAAGQLGVVLVVRFGIGVDLPLAWMLGIIAVLVLSNAALWGWYRGSTRRGAGEWILGSIMLLDFLLLSALLFLSSGPANPFSVFFLVNIALASALLDARWAWFLTACAIACFTGLFLFHRHIDMGWGGRGALQSSLYDMGTLIAVGVAAATLVYFVTRVKGELSRREAELGRERERQARSERLDALATLAAGAAHELATPLSTIAVVSKDLEQQLAGKAPAQDALGDVRLVREMVGRCRTILDQMAYDAGHSVGEAPVPIFVDELCEKVLARLPARERVRCSVDSSCREVRLIVPPNALIRAVRGIVRNALDASLPEEGGVALEAAVRQGKMLEIRVVDRGAGMRPEILERAGEPFFTTKEPGHGMGLGIFLARSILERLGGALHLESHPGAGTVATLRLPIERNSVV